MIYNTKPITNVPTSLLARTSKPPPTLSMPSSQGTQKLDFLWPFVVTLLFIFNITYESDHSVSIPLLLTDCIQHDIF